MTRTPAQHTHDRLCRLLRARLLRNDETLAALKLAILRRDHAGAGRLRATARRNTRHIGTLLDALTHLETEATA